MKWKPFFGILNIHQFNNLTMQRLTLFLSLLIIMGCSAPRYTYQAKPKDFKYNVNGLTIDADIIGEGKIKGEIIEVTDNEIKILTISSIPKIRIISKNKISILDVIITGTSDDPQRIEKWAKQMRWVSVGHGFWGLITFPINFGITNIQRNKASIGTYRMKYPKDVSWLDLKKFARFPQGIPDQVDESKIR